MTRPALYPNNAPGFNYPNTDALLGMGSEVDEKEWQTFLRRRQELANSLMGRVQLGQQTGLPQPVVDAVANQTEQQPGGIANARLSPPSSFELEKLRGAAKAYNIAGADQMDPQKLKSVVERRRLEVQQMQTPTHEKGALRNMGEAVLETAAMIGLGSTNTLLGFMRTVPFAGDWIQQQKVMQDAQQWFGGFEEMTRASLPDDMGWGHRQAYNVGGMIGYYFPAAGINRTLAAAGAIPAFATAASRLSPLTRMAMRNTAMAWTLEGGGDESLGTRAWNIAKVGAAGTALELLGPLLNMKITNSWLRRGGAIPRGTGVARARPGQFDDVPIVDFEVQGVEVPVMQARLGAGQASSPFAPPEGWRPPGPGGNAPAGPIPSGPPRLPATTGGQPPAGPIEVEPLPYAPEPAVEGQYTIDAANAGNRGRMIPSPERMDLQNYRRLATTDQLSQLGNKLAFDGRMHAGDADPTKSWVVFDGAQFKPINDHYGHAAGDKAIRHFGTALRQVAMELNVPNDVLFRTGGDEFAALVPKAVAQQFSDRVGEVSRISFGERSTRLEGQVGDSWSEADVVLGQNKEARRQANPQLRRGGDMPGEEEKERRGSAVAAEMSNQATIMESPIIDQVMGENTVSHATVARAAVAGRPAQISIVQGINDVGSTMRSLVEAQGKGQVKKGQFRVVQVDPATHRRVFMRPSDQASSPTGGLRFLGKGTYLGNENRPTTGPEAQGIEDILIQPNARIFKISEKSNPETLQSIIDLLPSYARSSLNQDMKDGYIRDNDDLFNQATDLLSPTNAAVGAQLFNKALQKLGYHGISTYYNTAIFPGSEGVLTPAGIARGRTVDYPRGVPQTRHGKPKSQSAEFVPMAPGTPLVKGYRGEGRGDKPSYNAASEGTGIYLAPEEQIARLFVGGTGTLYETVHQEPRKALHIKDEPLYALGYGAPVAHPYGGVTIKAPHLTGNEIAEPVKPGDSDWVRLNKRAYQLTAGMGHPTDPENREFGEVLTHLLRSEGYDALRVEHSGIGDWTVIYDDALMVERTPLVAEKPEKRTDILISEGLPITKKRVEQYQKYGMFEGQLATTAMGHEVRIVNPEGDFAVVQSVFGGENYLVPHDQMMPGKATHNGEEVRSSRQGAATYARFKDFAQKEMDREADKAGLAHFDWMGTEASTQIPRLMNEFLERQNMSAGQRMAMEAYFEHARLSEYSKLAPQEFAEARTVNAELNSAVVQVSRFFGPGSPEDLAAVKLFDYLSRPGGQGGQLIDQLSRERLDMETEGDALDFLRSFNREVPDHTPLGDVPLEVAPLHPMAGNGGIDLEPTVKGGEQQVVASMERILQNIIEELPPEQTVGLSIPTPVQTAPATTLPVVDQPAPMQGPAAPGPQYGPAPTVDWTSPTLRNTPFVAPPPQRLGQNLLGAGAVPGTPVTPPPANGPTPPPGGRPPVGVPPQPPPPPQPPTIGPAPQQQKLPPPRKMTLPEQFEAMRKSDPAALHQVLQKLDSVMLRWGAPMRSFTLQMQMALQKTGLSEALLWKHYNDLSTGITIGHNEARKWHQEWNDIMSQFRSKKKRDGTVMRIEEINDYNVKIAEMQKAGYNQRELNAQRRIRDFFDRMHGQAGIGNYVFAYVPRVRQRQAGRVGDPYKDPMLPKHIQFFAEFARSGNLQMRQQDIGVLGTTWIRAWQFNKHAEPAWNRMVAAWDDPRVPEEVRGIVQNWLHIVRTGYQPQHDFAIQGAKHTLNRMGAPVTDAEMAGMWNLVFSNMYRGQLGGRPDVILRDSISPLFTGARIGMTPVIRAYMNFIRGGGKAKDEMWDRAVKGGWVESGQVKSVNAEAFTQPVQNDQGVSLLTPEQQARRERLAEWGDFIHDMMPPSWRKGIQGSRFDPLFYYSKLGEFNRLISGEAGWQEAKQAINLYNSRVAPLLARQATNPNPKIAQLLDKEMKDLMKFSKARLYREPIQAEFQRLMAEGDHEGAANLMANEAANMQFRYGQREGSVGMQTAGTKGKMGMMFGTFSQQFASYTKESLGDHVPIGEKAAFLGRYGAIMGVLGAASLYTGWNFSKWIWHQALGYAGGPMLDAMIRAKDTVTGYAAMATGAPLDQDQQRAVERFNPGDVALDIISSINPYRSTTAQLGKYYDAVTGLNPVETTTRLTVTGETGQSSDFRQVLENTAPFTTKPAPGMPQTPPEGIGNGTTISARTLGVSNPSGVRISETGYPVYDTDRRTVDGKTPTHRLDIPSGRQQNETWEDYEDRVNARPINSFSPSDRAISRDPHQLDPDVRTPLMQMMSEAARQGVPLSINETYRPQSRQELLFKQGRSLPGGPVTWTLTSDHTTRRAADLAARDQRGYEWIQANGSKYGFKTLGMGDPGHVSIPLPSQLGAMAQQQGTGPAGQTAARQGQPPVGAGAMQ